MVIPFNQPSEKEIRQGGNAPAGQGQSHGVRTGRKTRPDRIGDISWAGHDRSRENALALLITTCSRWRRPECNWNTPEHGPYGFVGSPKWQPLFLCHDFLSPLSSIMALFYHALYPIIWAFLLAELKGYPQLEIKDVSWIEQFPGDISLFEFAFL